jgi:hypothetical protein
MECRKLVIVLSTYTDFYNSSDHLCNLVSHEMPQECEAHVSTWYESEYERGSKIIRGPCAPAVTPEAVHKLPSTTQRAFGTHWIPLSL